MKDKEKQIEEIVKITSMNCCECDTCKFNDMRRFGGCTDYLIANELYEQGYRKIDKDSVVLDQEEWKILHEDYAKALYEKDIQARKETAEKIFGQIIWYAVKRIGQTSNDSYYQISFDRLNELAKQFGVEIKE